MRKHITLTYPASPERVAQMLSDPGYQRRRLESASLDDVAVDVQPSDGGFTSTVSASLPAERVPSRARRFVRSGVSATITESWGAPAEDGSRTGTVAVAVKGAPAAVAASTAMSPAGEDSTTVAVDLELTVSVPLLGGKIEEKAFSMVSRAVDHEERTAAAWLAEH